MRNPLTTRIVAVLCLTVLFAAPAFAQIDARSQALLDGLMATGQVEPLESIDQTMVTTIYMDGQEMITSSRTVIDYVNRRAAIVSDIGGGVQTRMVHVDGQTTMRMAGMPMALPVPAGMGDAFDSIFDQTQTLSDDPDATAVYDGQVSYGDIVSGQQVTYTATYDSTEVTSRMIFNDADEYVAQVMDGEDGGLLIMVFDEPVGSTTAHFAARGMTMYQFKDGVGTLFSRTDFESVAIDEPLDEAVFQ